MQLYDEARLYRAGNRRIVTESDLQNSTLAEGEEITVYSKQVPEDKKYFWGFGPENRDRASGFIYGKFLASGSGTNTDGTVISNAEVVLAVTDADQRRVEASRVIATTGELNESQSEARSDQYVLPAQAPVAGPGKYLEIRLRALDGTAGGSEVASDSDVQLVFGELV